MKVIVMGVAGCGKSTVGAAVANKIGATYFDGDDLHPPSNIAKMSAGTPLNDADRAPWLDLIGQKLRDTDGPILVGCSALKRVYRDQITAAANGPVTFLHLSGTRAVIESRMSAREGHFMPVALLDSQFAALEPLQDDETSVIVDIEQTLDGVIAQSVRGLQG